MSTAPAGAAYSARWEAAALDVLCTDLETLSLVRVRLDLGEPKAGAGRQEPQVEYIDQIGFTPSSALGLHAFVRLPDAELCWYLDCRPEAAPLVKMIRRTVPGEPWRIDLPAVHGSPLHALAHENAVYLFTWESGLWVQSTSVDGSPLEDARELLAVPEADSSPPVVPFALPVRGSDEFSLTTSTPAGVLIVGVHAGRPLVRGVPEAHPVHAVARVSPSRVDVLSYDEKAQELVHLVSDDRGTSTTALIRCRDTSSVALLDVHGRPCYLFNELTLLDEQPLYSLTLLFEPSAVASATPRLSRAYLYTSPNPITSFVAATQGGELRVLLLCDRLWLLRADLTISSE
ncbi:MAG: hypothetical protein JXB46_09045 [Candidatus Eisenbacteria bacterium]|nr:hypothetical protein [Candidatus Eisenbacteria bacterium]